VHTHKKSNKAYYGNRTCASEKKADLFPLSACIQSRVAEAVAVIKVFPTVTAAQLISTAVCVQSSCCPAEGLLL